MRLDKVLTLLFPELVAPIQRELCKAGGNERILRLFCRFSQLDEDTARAALTNPKEGPLLRATFMPATRQGQFVTSSPDTVWINSNVCQYYKRYRDRSYRGEMEHHIGRTVIHEMVHWGDFKSDGKIQTVGIAKRERGWAFEKRAFGDTYVPGYFLYPTPERVDGLGAGGVPLH